MTTTPSITEPTMTTLMMKTEPSISSTMTTMKSTSPTTMKVETKLSPSSAMSPVNVEDQRKIKLSKWKPLANGKKSTPRKLEDESGNSNSYYPVPRNNPAKHYHSHPPPPPSPLAGLPF